MKPERMHETPKDKPHMMDWNKEADFYNAFAFCELEDTQRYLDEINIEPHDSVLDVCCGPGRISVLAAKHASRVTAFDSAESMLDHARRNAEKFGVDNIDFKLLDWNCVLPGQNLGIHDIVIASRNQAIGDIEKLSSLATKRVAVQIFADAPSIPSLLNVLYSGCGMPTHGPRPGAAGPNAPRPLGYMDIVNKAYGMGFKPNVRIMPERFRKQFASEQDACAWVCSLKPQFSEGNESRIAANIEPFLTSKETGVEFCIATTAAIIWWDLH